MTEPHLSKSLYLSALQCDRRLWFDINTPEKATPVTESQRHIFRMGTEVGRAAHHLFPGGLLVDAPAWDHAAALRQTRDAMAEETVPALFEAAFEYEGVRIRVDILERLGAADEGRWGIREVKSSSKVKPEQHLPDLAIQKWVVEKCGVDVQSAELIHVSKRFVRGADEIHWPDYFARAEQIEELAVQSSAEFSARLEAMHKTLEASSAPIREPGSFCKKPHLCGYWNYCTAKKSASWVIAQTGASKARKARMIDVIESDRPWFSNELADELADARPPIWALDFEAIGPAIPFYPGTRAYQAITFQWSLHRLGEDGKIEHLEYLADGREDPRPEVARTLIEALGRDSAPILVYSSYEARCLKDMAARVPDLANAIEGILDRLVDLLPIVRGHVYHPEMNGSFSIKAVGPAFAPQVSYGDLEGVADGMAALAAFARLVGGELGRPEAAKVRRELLAYCRLDTLALLEMYRALRDN